MADFGDSKAVTPDRCSLGTALRNKPRSSWRRTKIFSRSNSGSSLAAFHTTSFSANSVSNSRNARLQPAIRASNSSTFTFTEPGGSLSVEVVVVVNPRLARRQRHVRLLAVGFATRLSACAYASTFFTACGFAIFALFTACGFASSTLFTACGFATSAAVFSRASVSAITSRSACHVTVF